jgi:hypothetical protein
LACRSTHKANGDTCYSVDLIADSFAVLSKAKVRTIKEEMED